jgi:precorrin-2 methylase
MTQRRDGQRTPEHGEAAARRPASLLVVGTGIQWGGQTTLGAEAAISGADRVLFAVADPWAAHWIRSLCPTAQSLPYPRDGRPRRSIYREMTERILAALALGGRVCAVFYGSPTLLARSAHDAIREARSAGYRAAMLPGVSSLDCLCADMGIDFGDRGVQVMEATALLGRRRTLDVHGYLVVCQMALIGNRSTFEDDPQRVARGLRLLQDRLLQDFPRDHVVYLYEASRHPLCEPRMEPVRLEDLEQASVHEISTLCVPPLSEAPVDRRMTTVLAGRLERTACLASQA